MSNDELFKQVIREMVEQELKELDEMTTTGDIAGYNIPGAFSGNSDVNKARKKKIATQFGYTLTDKGAKDMERGADALHEASWTAAASMHAATRKSNAPTPQQPKKSAWKDGEPMSVAGKAKKLGLVYMKFGRWGKDGKVTHVSDGENGLRPVKEHTLEEGRIRYHEYKKDESASPTKKIAKAISEVNKNLQEMERVLHMNSRLQKESGLASEALYRRTQQGLLKLEARLLHLAGKVRDIRGK